MLSDLREYVGHAADWVKKNRRTAGQIAAVALILIIAVVMRIYGNSSKQDVEEIEDDPIEAYVDISGEVNKPGIYTVNEDTRLFEVIEMAGGLKDNADVDSINQAEFITDGQKIIIPSNTEIDSVSADSSVTASDSSASSSGKININTASKEELKELSGIGDVIAERIIEYRNGSRFNSTEDIKNVKGIGDAIYEKIRSNIAV